MQTGNNSVNLCICLYLLPHFNIIGTEYDYEKISDSDVTWL